MFKHCLVSLFDRDPRCWRVTNVERKVYSVSWKVDKTILSTKFVCAPLNGRAATDWRDARYQHNPPLHLSSRAIFSLVQHATRRTILDGGGDHQWAYSSDVWRGREEVDEVPPPIPTAGGSFFFGTNCRCPQGPPTVFDRLRQLF